MNNVYKGLFKLIQVSSLDRCDFSNGVELHPEWGFSENNVVDTRMQGAISGKMYTYQPAKAAGYSYTFPLSFFADSDKQLVNEWWRNKTEVYLVDRLTPFDFQTQNSTGTLISSDTTISSDTDFFSPYDVSSGITVTVNSGVSLSIVWETVPITEDTQVLSPYEIHGENILDISSGITFEILGETLLKTHITNRRAPLTKRDFTLRDKWAGVVQLKSTENNPKII